MSRPAVPPRPALEETEPVKLEGTGRCRWAVWAPWKPGWQWVAGMGNFGGKGQSSHPTGGKWHLLWLNHVFNCYIKRIKKKKNKVKYFLQEISCKHSKLTEKALKILNLGSIQVIEG